MQVAAARHRGAELRLRPRSFPRLAPVRRGHTQGILASTDAGPPAARPMSKLAPAPLDLAGPEFTLSPADSERIRSPIRERAGIGLHAGKRAMVPSRLARRLRETRPPGFSAHPQWLERGGAAQSEWQAFVDGLSPHLASFFREEHHFHALAEDLRARAACPIRVWCDAADARGLSRKRRCESSHRVDRRSCTPPRA